MANITRNFIAGRMNKVVDERLIPDGQYIDALNVRMGSTEQKSIGAIENTKGLKGDLKKDRTAVRDSLAKVKEFNGITGKMAFDGKSGDPIKCAVIVRINPEGKFKFYKMVCP